MHSVSVTEFDLNKSEWMTNSRGRTLESNGHHYINHYINNKLWPSKEYGLNRLTPFTGDRTKIENFIQECDVYLAINEAIYDNELAKVSFMLSFMSDK